MATEKQIQELSAALIRAKECANKLSEADDEGTCNFDAPQICLKGWRAEEAQRAFERAELRCDIQKSGNAIIVDVYGCLIGQASRRTQMAKAVRDSLKADGYEAYVYYKID